MAHDRGPTSIPLGAPVRIATRFAVVMRMFANAITLASLVSCAVVRGSIAGALIMNVIDKSGRGVGDTVVTITPLGGPPAAAAKATAIMDQRNLEFVPRVLVVSVGTSVDFPNNDTVSHQVYSFSAAKRFQLPLYKGERHSPVEFDQEGLVVLGCNIHDTMAGYIYVTAAPYFGTTDAKGTLQIPGLAAGDFRVTIWSPFIADPAASLVRTVHVEAADVTPFRFQLTRELRTRPEPRPRRGDWEY
jgi:plastocyanin